MTILVTHSVSNDSVSPPILQCQFDKLRAQINWSGARESHIRHIEIATQRRFPPNLLTSFKLSSACSRWSGCKVALSISTIFAASIFCVYLMGQLKIRLKMPDFPHVKNRPQNVSAWNRAKFHENSARHVGQPQMSSNCQTSRKLLSCSPDGNIVRL
jgi:hypothetical protein